MSRICQTGPRPRLYFVHEGRALTLRDLSTVTGIPYPTLKTRADRGARGAKLVRPARKKLEVYQDRYGGLL